MKTQMTMASLTGSVAALAQHVARSTSRVIEQQQHRTGAAAAESQRARTLRTLMQVLH